MTTSRMRLRRLLAAELGECCDADVDRRLDDLHALADDALGDDPIRRVFATLGDDTRYRLARVLAASADERCVCELEPLVDVSESAVSHALSDLVAAGLVTRRKDGNWRYYRATDLATTLFATADRAAADRTTAEPGTAAEASGAEAGADGTSVDEVGADETSIDEVGADGTSVDEVGADETPVVEAGADETSVNEMAADEVPGADE